MILKSEVVMIQIIIPFLLVWTLLTGCAVTNYQDASPLRKEGIKQEVFDAIVLTVIEELTRQGNLIDIDSLCR